MKPVGLLALQGGYAAHAKILRGLGIEHLLVRRAADLDLGQVGGLVLPGGESTTQLKLIRRFDLGAPLDSFVRSGAPILCTCAGLILAASEVTDPRQQSFGWIDVSVARNAWGRQVHSFEASADATGRRLIFIRAPRITRVGEQVEILETFGGEPVLVRQGNVTGATFHPELTEDASIHSALFGGG